MRAPKADHLPAEMSLSRRIADRLKHRRPAGRRRSEGSYFFPPLPILPAVDAALGALSFFGLRFSLLDRI